MKRSILFKAVLVVASLGAAVSCSRPESTRWDDKAAEVKAGQQPKVDKATVAAGAGLNSFFPAETGGVTRTFTQEKLGYAEAKVVTSGKTAKASISDTNNNPSARTKFSGASESIGGHPLVTVGKNQSAILVGGRWQVKVSSSELDAGQRKAVLDTFDLAGLANKK